MPEAKSSSTKSGNTISWNELSELIEPQRSPRRETPRAFNSGAILPSQRKPGKYRIEANTVNGLVVLDGAQYVGAADAQTEIERASGSYQKARMEKDVLASLVRDLQRMLKSRDLPEDEIAELEVIDVSDGDRFEADSTCVTADALADEILSIGTENPSHRLREVILLAEDTEFTLEQSARLAPRLLELAERHSRSNDPQDKPVVLSAIRTGASMLHPSEAERLLPLLKPGRSIETSLVALKMLGRVFEAQPPDDIDQFESLANEARSIAESLLNPHVIVSSQSAAKAQLAVYALAAMGSRQLVTMTQTIRQLAVEWFTRRTAHKLRELDEFWQSQRCNVASAHRDLVSGALAELQN